MVCSVLCRVVEDAHVIRTEAGDGLSRHGHLVRGQEGHSRVGTRVVWEHLTLIVLHPLAIFTELHAVKTSEPAATPPCLVKKHCMP